MDIVNNSNMLWHVVMICAVYNSEYKSVKVMVTLKLSLGIVLHYWLKTIIGRIEGKKLKQEQKCFMVVVTHFLYILFYIFFLLVLYCNKTYTLFIYQI